MKINNVKFSKLEEVNSALSKVVIKICKPGANRNGTYISKKVLTKASEKSLGLVPIIGLYSELKEDFLGHERQARPLGVIPEQPNFYFDRSGYLCVEGYLWTSKYPEAKEILKGKGQSMELDPAQTSFGKERQGCTEITETAFLALTVLGDDVEPCFEEADIKKAEENLAFALKNTDMNKEIKEMAKELEHSLKEKVVVDLDGKEQKRKNQKKITKAIDKLDEENSKEKNPVVEEAIEDLVEVETDLNSEPDVVVLDENSSEGLNTETDVNYANVENTEEAKLLTDSISTAKIARAKEMMKDISDEELVALAVEKVADLKKLELMLKNLITPLTETAEKEDKAMEEAQNKELEDEVVDKDKAEVTEEDKKEVTTEEAPKTETVEKEDETVEETPETEAPVKEDETKKEEVVEEEVPVEEEEEKKKVKVKKDKFALEETVKEELQEEIEDLEEDKAEAIIENNGELADDIQERIEELEAKIAELENENYELKTALNAVNRVEKEKLLNEFELSSLEKANIMAKIDDLTMEEVKKEALYALYEREEEAKVKLKHSLNSDMPVSNYGSELERLLDKTKKDTHNLYL